MAWDVWRNNCEVFCTIRVYRSEPILVWNSAMEDPHRFMFMGLK
jgi:hypothetical protein